jgi:hypothetical protein
MHRLAPVQCVFWGHPISQGLTSIDYFITSDLFEQDRHHHVNINNHVTMDTQHSEVNGISNNACLWRQDSYHEQSIRMDGLTAYFSKPLLKPSQSSAQNTLTEFGLPSDTHIYLIPQVS